MSSYDNHIQSLQSFTNAHGAPGGEQEIASILSDRLSSWGTPSQDRVGSVAFTKGSTGPHIMIAAHMDEVGFRVQSITKNGFIKFLPVGGWWAHTLLAQQVVIKTRKGTKITGVIGSTPVHFLPASERSKVLPLESMFIDIGARSADDVAALGIQLGDYIVPATEFTPLAGKQRFLAKAFDNRVGCAAVADLGDILPHGVDEATLSLAATVQEEVGLRGSATLAHQLQPDFAIILEGTPADDTPGFSPDASQGALEKGVQIRMHDPSAIMSPLLVDLARDVAEEEGINHQLAMRTSGGTDAGTFAYANSGIPSIVLGVPARYIHSHCSIIDLSDYLDMINLAAGIARQLGSQKYS